MPRKTPLEPSPKLQQLQREFQQIAAMAGFLNSAFDLPQLRLQFTLYGRVLLPDPTAAEAALPKLQAWCDQMCIRLREDSSSAILPPQVSIPAPQPLPNGEAWALVATLQFNSKVTDNSYVRVRTAVLAAYQEAVALRERGL